MGLKTTNYTVESLGITVPEAYAKIKELESDNFAKDERIKNLLKRNEELRFSLGAQYDREKEEPEEEKEEEEIFSLKEIAKII